MKKLLCVALALIMVLGTCATTAMASEGFLHFYEEGDELPDDGPLTRTEYDYTLTGYVENENLVLDSAHNVTVTSSDASFIGIGFGFPDENTGDTSQLVSSVGKINIKSNGSSVAVPGGTTSLTLSYNGPGELLIFVNVTVMTRHYHTIDIGTKYLKNESTIAVKCVGDVLPNICDEELLLTLVCPSKVYDGKPVEFALEHDDKYYNEDYDRNFHVFAVYEDYYRIEGDQEIYLNDVAPSEIGNYYVTANVYYNAGRYGTGGPLECTDTVRTYFSITDGSGSTGNGSETSPKTGDTMSAGLYLAIAAAGAVTLAGGAFAYKKRR